jgi:hypothetical protein
MSMLQTQGVGKLTAAATYEWLELEDLHSEPLKAGVAWWRKTRGERPFPTREELVPRQIAELLAYMSLVKVIDGGADFEHRIVGDVMVQAFNVRVQNRRFSEIARDAPAFIAQCFEIFRRVVDLGKPQAWRATEGPNSTAVVFRYSEVVLLPLGRENVEFILGFCCHGASTRPSHPPHACRRD